MSLTDSQREQFRRVRSAMVKAGVTNAQIARDAKPAVSTVFVYYVLTGQRKGYRIREDISRATGVPTEILWPDTPPGFRSAA